MPTSSRPRSTARAPSRSSHHDGRDLVERDRGHRRHLAEAEPDVADDGRDQGGDVEAEDQRPSRLRSIRRMAAHQDAERGPEGHRQDEARRHPAERDREVVRAARRRRACATAAPARPRVPGRSGWSANAASRLPDGERPEQRQPSHPRGPRAGDAAAVIRGRARYPLPERAREHSAHAAVTARTPRRAALDQEVQDAPRPPSPSRRDRSGAESPRGSRPEARAPPAGSVAPSERLDALPLGVGATGGAASPRRRRGGTR